MFIPDDGRAFLTVKDLIDLGYGTRTAVYRDVHNGIVPSIQVGKQRILIPRDEFIEAMEARRRIVAPADVTTGDGVQEAVM